MKTKLHLKKDYSYYSSNQPICYGITENYTHADINSFKDLDTSIHRKLHHIYPLITDRDLKRKFHSISVSRSKENDSVLIYNKISTDVLKSKLKKLCPTLDIRYLTNKQLLEKYFDILNSY